MKVVVCAECGGEDWANHEKMRRVTGQVDGLNQEVTVAQCRVCGHRQEAAA